MTDAPTASPSISIDPEVGRDLRAYLRELANQLHGDMRQGDVGTLLVEASALATWPLEQVPEDVPAEEVEQHEIAYAELLVDELERAARDGSTVKARALWAMLLLQLRMPVTATGIAAGSFLADDPDFLQLHELPDWLQLLDEVRPGETWRVDVLDGAARLWFIDIAFPGDEPACLEIGQDRLEMGVPSGIELLSGTAAELVVESAANLARAHAEDDELEGEARVGTPVRCDAAETVPALRDALAVGRVLAAYGALDDDVLSMLGFAGWTVAQLVDQHLAGALSELDALGANDELKAMAERGIFQTEANELTFWRNLGDDERERLASDTVALATAGLGEMDAERAHEVALRMVDVSCDRFLDGPATFTDPTLQELLEEVARQGWAATDADRSAICAIFTAWEEVTRTRLAEVAPGSPAPAAAAVDPAARAEAVEGLEHVAEELHLLDRRRRLTPGSSEDQQGVAMRLIGAMREAGVDPSDPSQREAWMERWDTLTPEQQLGELGLVD